MESDVPPPVDVDSTLEKGLLPSPQTVILTCPEYSLPECRLAPDNLDRLSRYLFRRGPRAMPDLQLSLSFTELLSPTQQVGENGVARDSLVIYSELTNNVNDRLASTSPTLLLIGMNLVGVAELLVRQSLKTTSLATLGFIDVSLWLSS